MLSSRADYAAFRGRDAGRLGRLADELKSSVSGLDEFCDTVRKLLPDTAGQKGIDLADIAKVTVEQLKPLSDAVSALYVNYRNSQAATHETIRTQLKRAKWLAFSEVKATQ